MMKIKKISFLFLILLLAIFIIKTQTSYAFQTYPIAEPDLLKEIMARAKKININKIRKKLKEKTLHYTLKGIYVPPSKKSYSYLYDVVYTLPFNIPRTNSNGKVIGILYPKGFTFHVLDYIPYNFEPLVLFDIKNPMQVWWITKHYSNNLNVKLITVDGDLGDILKLVRKFKRPVYLNLKKINIRFNVKNTISIISRDKVHRRCVLVKVIGMDKIKKEYEKYLKEKKRKTGKKKEGNREK